MNDETKDELMKRTREWLQSCVNAATRSGVPEEADLEAFILAHIDGEPARMAAARRESALSGCCYGGTGCAVETPMDAWCVGCVERVARDTAAREEQREALGLDRWPVLIPFIAAMVQKLDANRPKKGGREGWRNDDPSALVRRVIEEAEELEHAVDTQPRGLILAEAADVANMALMVADAAGALDATPLDARPWPTASRSWRRR